MRASNSCVFYEVSLLARIKSHGIYPLCNYYLFRTRHSIILFARVVYVQQSVKGVESRELELELAAVFCKGECGTDSGGDRNRGEIYCRGQQTCGRGT